MTKKEIALSAVEALKKEYPDAKCSLDYETPLQLLVATRLSAQCTDARVNLVTPALFARFPDAESLAGAEVSEVAEYIKSCGLYKTKSKDLVAPGIGRKTANLICGDVYGKPAVVVDTHCIRITTRLGLHKETDQRKIENALRKLLPPEESNDFCHRIVLHGRAVCTARSPKCKDCCMNGFCRMGVKELKNGD